MSSVVAELSLIPIENKAACRPLPDGPGWFDSSWELRSGLQVKEGWPADISLHSWTLGWLDYVFPRAASTASPSSTTAIA